MKKYINNYIKNIEIKIDKGNYKQINIDELKYKISLFQHERLIHLIVTMFFSLFFLISLFLIMLSYYFAVVFVIFLSFEIFYIKHYFFLENSVQYLYTLYDKVMKNMEN